MSYVAVAIVIALLIALNEYGLPLAAKHEFGSVMTLHAVGNAEVLLSHVMSLSTQ